MANPSLRELGTFAGQFIPGAGLADAAGFYPASDKGFNPSFRDNWKAGNYGAASLQALGALADLIPVAGPATKMSLAALGAVPAMKAATKVAEAAPALGKGIIAYHGSPHSFDKFDLSKIGTGEGAQSYGHGLYFADNEDVARGYRDRIAGANWIDKRGVPLSSNTIANDIMDQARKDGLGPIEANDAAGMWSIVARDGESASNFPGYKSVKTVLDRHGLQLKPNGSMYQVRINADPEHFLDWDKPLSGQPEAVRSAAENMKSKSFLAKRALEAPDATGRTVWEKSRNPFVTGAGVGNDPAAASMLREAGIPGIKYLDQGSRGAGEGSRNYVVFDDSLIEILKKYGLLAGVGIPAAYGASQAQPQQSPGL